MKIRTPALLFASLYFILLVSLNFTRDQLPESVATHFNASGQADGWTSRTNHLALFAIFGLLFPGFIVVSFYVVRFFPPSMINLPNREYWTAPERLRETHNFLFRRSLWFGSLAVTFFIGLHFAILEANSHPRPELSLPIFLSITGAFVLGVLIWCLTLILPFRRIPEFKNTAPSANGA